MSGTSSGEQTADTTARRVGWRIALGGLVVTISAAVVLVAVVLPDEVDVQQDGWLEAYRTSIGPIVTAAVFPDTGGHISTTSDG